MHRDETLPGKGSGGHNMVMLSTWQLLGGVPVCLYNSSAKVGPVTCQTLCLLELWEKRMSSLDVAGRPHAPPPSPGE